MAKPFLLFLSFDFALIYVRQVFINGGAPKMRYCLWKSIGNHHIPTTDSYFLNLYLINDEVQLCKKKKTLALLIMIHHAYNIVQY